MDKHGNIYELFNNPNPEAVIEELDLVVIPDEDRSFVLNLSEKDRIAWYHKNKLDPINLETAS